MGGTRYFFPSPLSRLAAGPTFLPAEGYPKEA